MSNKTIASEFKRIAKWYPDRDAFVQVNDGRRYTYEEANHRACRFANALRDNGVKKGDRVAFLSKTVVDHAITYFGCLKIGAIPAPLHHREAPNVITAMIEDVRPEVLIYQNELFDKIEPNIDEINSVSEFISFDKHSFSEATSLSAVLSDVPKDELDVEIAPDETAFICFSSGTTGTPKGIVHTHDDTIECAHLGQYILSVQDNDVLLNAFTPSFIGWENMVFPFVMAGGTTVLLEEWDPEVILETIVTEDITTALFVPTQWKEILRKIDAEHHDLSSFRVAGYAGETISPDLLSQIRETFAENVVGDYGTTETHFSGAALFSDQNDLDSIGRPVPQCDIRIVDPERRDPSAELPTGEIGELIVRGPSVADEVWENPQKTEDIIIDGWFFSGDLAKIKDSGDIKLLGRTDNMIISGGINIYAEKVEEVLESHPDLNECAIVGVSDETHGEKVKAFVVASQELTVDEIDSWCKSNDDLSDYQRPRVYEFMKQLPRTNTGKLNREALRSE